VIKKPNTIFKSTIKCSTTHTVGVIFSVAFLGLMIHFLFYNTFTFNYETYLNQQYILVFWLPVLAMLLIWLFKFREYFSYKLGIGLVVMASVASFLCFSYYYSFGNEYFFTIGTIAIACYCVFLLNQINLLQAIVFAFVLLFVLQVNLGVQQQFSLRDDNNLLITGTLQNSGVYAYYLVFNLPFFYWCCFSSSKRLSKEKNMRLVSLIFKFFFAFVFIVVFYLICCTQSRTAIICLGITIGYFIFSSYKSKILAVVKFSPKSILLLIGAITIGSMGWISIWLFNLKKMSAIGRLLSFDIAWQHIADHFWLGVGLGRFTWYYPQWQVAYFDTNPKPTLAYFFSAGESYIIFNEYLQLFETIGLLGFLLCTYGFYRFFKLRVIKNRSLLLSTKCTALAILCSGFTSYPLHVNIILFLLGTCLAIGFSLNDRPMPIVEKKQWLYINKALITLCLFLVCFAFHKGYVAYSAVNQWAILRNTNGLETLPDYERVYPILKNDGKFLTEYGAALLKDRNNISTAISILEQAKQLSITRHSIESLATAYCNAKNYNATIVNQQFLVNYLPNKFLPKYNLLQTYILRNDTINVKKTANTILQMPVKINSFQVEQIMENTRDILRKHLN
jgi:O-antigen ligase